MSYRHLTQSLTGRLDRGFSLYELLAVVSIISILATMTVPSLSSLLGHQKLASTVSMISNTALQARQLAMSSGDPVAMVVCTPSDAPLSVLLMRGTQSGEGDGVVWRPASRGWSEADETVQANSATASESGTFYMAGSVDAPNLGSLGLPLRGETVSDYEFVIFRPNGSVDAPAATPHLALSHINSPDEEYDCLILFQEASGRTKIVWN